MGFLLSSLASELKAADKLKGEGPESQKKGASAPGGPSARANGWWGAGARVPKDGYLPVIVAGCQELPTG